MPHHLKCLPRWFLDLLIVTLCVALVGACSTAAAQEPESRVDPVLDGQASVNQDTQKSQRLIDEADDEISASIAENHLARQELARIKI